MISKFNKYFYKIGLNDDGRDMITGMICRGGITSTSSAKLCWEDQKLTRVFCGQVKKSQHINIPVGCKLLYAKN